MSTTTINNKNNEPQAWFIFIFGTLILILKFASVFFFAWFMCLMGVAGVETMRLGKNAMSSGIALMPTHYYIAAAYITIFFTGIMQIARTIVVTGILHSSSAGDAGDNTEKDKKE